VADETAPVHDADADHSEHAAIHMPPNSLVPINVALALATTFVGFVDQVRNTVGPLVWGIGVIWFIASCVVWFLAARNEFGELPESADGH
jgi:hypothetical protein